MVNRVTACIARYLLSCHFTSKKAMADELGVPYHVLLDVCAGRGTPHEASRITNHMLRYCLQHHIALEAAMADFN